MTIEPPDLSGLGRRLAERRRLDHGVPAAAEDARPPSEYSPLTFAQQGIWLFEQLHPGTAVNNLVYCGLVTGQLEIQRLATAFRAVVLRHAILRTTFHGAAWPEQRVHQEPLGELEVVDLADIPAGQRRKAAERHARSLGAAPFDLEHGPLVRVVVYPLSARRSLLLLAASHLIADGWSLGVFVGELSEAYSGRYPADPPVCYAPLAAGERRDRINGKDLDFWQQQLQGQRQLTLPADYPRPAVPTFRSGTVPISLPAELTAGIRQLAAATGSTPFMVLLCALQVLMARMCGQEDITVGSPAAARSRGQAKHVIGPLVNLLALRADLAGDPSFREALGRVRRACLDAYAHQDAPFDLVVERLRPGRDLSRSPVFQTLFTLQDEPPRLALGPLRVRPVLLRPSAFQRELELYLWSSGSGIKGFLGYHAELFAAVTAERIAERFGTLVAGAVADPGRRVSAVPVLGPAERAELGRLRAGRSAPPCARLVHQLFEDQASRNPGALAVDAAGAALTYRQLDQQASTLAGHLRARGIGPGALVGVCLPRQAILVVTLLAVLKAGGAYVPLDPDYPPARISFILADAAAALLITTSGIASRAPASCPVLLDPAPLTTAPAPAAGPAPGPGPGDLAYVIYTSGSTGQPKGVMIEHRQTTAMITWANRLLAPRDTRHVLASTSVCFDLSVYELFATLAAGHAITLTEHTALDLLTAPPRQPVTLLNTVPSIARELLAAGAIPATVTTVSLAGEPLPPALVRDLHQLPHIRAVRNWYGPSEDTTYTTHARTDPRHARTPIGRPADGTQIHLLDSRLQPVPLGSTGEIYIGGTGVTRGYHNQPALTAGRYLPDPYATSPGARLYRTGDLARWRPDRQLDFLGRRDHQIKLRGHRIEPGEIEAALTAHPLVTDAAVTTRSPLGHDSPQLIAYLTPQLTPDQLTALTSYLATRLPRPLIPALLIPLPALPRTPNGKLDRTALPDPRPAPPAAPAPPATPAEKLIAAIWTDLLAIPAIDTHDNFFALGGHSLLAARATARLTQQTGTPIPLRLTFDHPTIAQLAPRLPATRTPHAPIPRLTRELRGSRPASGLGFDDGAGPVHPAADAGERD